MNHEPKNILAISDAHGDLTVVHALLAAADFDLVICCGDWGDPGQLQREDYERLLAANTIYSVYGNHDDMALLSELCNRDGSPVLLRNGELVTAAGLTLMGVGGIWAKSHRLPWYITDEDVLQYGQAGEKLDILITHGCGIGLNDRTPSGTRGGQRCFTELFSRVQSQAYICGHLHRAQIRQTRSGAWVANVGHTAEGDYLIITTAPDGVRIDQGHVDPRQD